MIELIISDFDGTLVDTFDANFYSYEKAFNECDIDLDYAFYSNCFGLRYDEFIDKAGVERPDIIDYIRRRKGELYPTFFHFLRLNELLYNFLMVFRKSGGRIAIASTASKNNLFNVMKHFKMIDQFDYILAGNEVKNGKPDPEIYLTLIKRFNVDACNTLIFEDTTTGYNAATAAGANCIKVTSPFFDHKL